jgi:hypothetical protein
MTDWLYDVRGKEVVFTGDDPDYSREDLEEIVYRLGASRVHDWVNKKTTDVLVRCGHSDRWKYGDYGRKEVRAAEMQAEGRAIVVIDVPGLLGLREEIPAPTLVPNTPTAPARAAATAGGALGAPYRAGRHLQPVQGDGEVYRDPDRVERGLRGHSATQDALATLVASRGCVPLSPFDRTCNYDLGWLDPAGTANVAEVKSLTDSNEAFQIRHGLGQVLDYAHRLRQRGFSVKPVLAVEREPTEAAHWAALCNRQEVVLTWAPDFAELAQLPSAPSYQHPT